MTFLDPGQQPSDKGPRQLPTDELASLGTQERELPSAEDLLGPKPQAAKGETDELPSLEDLLGPRPSEPVKPLTGRVADFFFTDPRSALTHIGAAFGQTLNTDLSDENLDIPKETRDWLRKKGVWGDFASGHVSLQQAMIESYMRQGAMRVNHAIMAVPALVHAASAAIAQAGEETRGTGLERTFQAIGLGSPQQLTREVAAIPEAFPTFDFHNGIATTEQLRAHPVWKQIEEARDLKVIGKDGEAGWKGLHVAEPRTAAEAPREAAPLKTPPAEAEAAAPTPPAPAFDIHAEARRIDPGTFDEYDKLERRRNTLRGWIEDPAIVMRPANLESSLRETEKRILEMAPKVNAAYAEAGKGLPNAGRTVEASHPGAPAAPAAEAEAAPAGPQGEAAVPAEGGTPARMAGAEGAQAGRTITPPVNFGFVRFYHGADKEASPPSSGGGRWVTSDPQYARRFRAGTEDKKVWYVDIPKGDPAEVAARAWDEIDERGGTNMVGVYRHVEVPEEWAKRMRPFEPTAEWPAARTVDRTHDVPYLAGSSNDGTTTYIDKRVPAELTVKGVTFDPAKYLSVHEATEHALMVDHGEPYETAHREALKAEQAAVEADGIDWKAYQEEMTKLVGTTEHEKAKTPPPDLYTKPYPHAEAEFLKREGEATPAAIPSPAAGVAAPETAANVSRETPGKKIPSLDEQRDYIIADMREQLRKVRKAEPGESEQTRQARIDAEAQLYASQMITLAGLFEGKLGTAEDLYRAEGIEIQKAGAIAKKIQRAGLGAVRTVAMAGERMAEGKKNAAERRAQGLGTGGKITTEAQRYATMAKEDKEALKAAYEDEREALEPEEREGVPEAAGLMSDDDWEFMAQREAAGLPLFQRVNPETRDLVTQAKQAEADLRHALEGVEVGGSEVQPMDLALNKGLINRLPPEAKAAAERHAELSAAIDAKLEALDAQITKALQGVEVDGDPVDLMDIAVNRRLRESVPAEVQALMDERDVLTSNEAAQRELYQIQAYHGSPHHFERFDISKIGIGEGWQSYGKGLYFAEHEGVAKGYQTGLAPQTLEVGNKRISIARNDTVWAEKTAEQKAADTIRRIVTLHPDHALDADGWDAAISATRHEPEAQAILRSWREQGAKVSTGALYRVILKPDKEDLLDWDKPLSEQSEKVKAAVAKAGIEGTFDVHVRGPEENGVYVHHTKAEAEADAAQWRLYGKKGSHDVEIVKRDDDLTGEQIYREFARRKVSAEDQRAGFDAHSPTAASHALRDAGIPGIKYADAGSRTDPARIKTQLDQVREAIATVEKQTDSNTKAERLGNLRRDEERLARDYEAAVNPTHNFVIFNDKDIEITHRNGEPLTKEERTEAVDELEQRREAAVATKELAQRGLEQTARRGSYAPALEGERPLTRLGRAQNASTVIHEFGHDFLEKLARYAEHPLASDQLKSDWEETKKYLEIGSGRDIREIDEKGELTKKARFAHERFATAYEQWLMLGVAPSRALVRVFTQFRNWLLKVYDSYEALVKATPHGREVVRPLTPEMIQVFRRMHDINPDDTIIAPSPRMQPGLGDIHEARAEAAEALPSQVGHGVASEIQGERDSHAAANVVEEEHARLTDVEARTGERAPGTPQPPGHPDETGTQRGEAGGAAAPGEVVPGGGEAAAQRAGEGASRAGASLDKGSGVKTEPPPNANVSFGPNSKHTDAAGNFRTDGLTDVNKIFDALRENAAKQGGIVQKRRAGIPLTDGDRLNLGLTAGLDPSWLDAKQIGDAYSEREVEALQRLIVQISTEIKDLSAAAATGDEAAVLAKAEKNSLLELVQAHLSGATAEWGRTGGAIRRVVKKAWGNLPQKTVAEATASLAAVRRMKGQKWESPEQLSLALKQETGRTLFQTQEVAEYTSRLTNPAQVARLIADTSNGRMTQAVQFYYVNALLSGPITHFRYAIGNGVTALYAPAKITVAATFDWAMYQAGIREQQMVFHGEAWEELWALTYGSRKAFQAGKEGWRLGNTPDLPGEVHPDIFGAQPIMPPIHGIWGQIIGTPGKAVGFIHGFGSQLRYEQGIAKLAYRNAMLEKLEGDAFKNRMAELQNRPTPEMMEQAAMVARKDLYMAPAEYGSFLANLSRVSDTNIITKVLMPFVKIGMNIDKIAVVEGTPAGLFAKKVRANLLGHNGQVAQAEQSANLIAGMGMMGMATLMVAEGMATGDGPNDPNLRREWLKTNEPNSIKVGPFWLSYKGLGAIGMQMRLAANSYEAGHGWGEDEHYSTALALLEGFEKAVLGESFMTGLKDMIEAVYHAEEHGERYIANMITNWLPFSVGLGQMTKLFDPYERETHARTTLEQVGKATLEHIPFASRMLYPRRDSFGEPISAHGLNPSYANDPLVRAMSELHVPVAPIKHTIRGVQLTDAQYDEYAMLAGRKARENMNITLRTAGRGYRTFAPEERVRLINLFKKDHEEAEKEAADYVMGKSIVHGRGLNKYGDTNDIMKQAIENTKVKKGIEARPVPH